MSAVVFASYSSFAVIQPAFWCVCVCVFKVKIYLRCTEGTAGRKAAAEPTNARKRAMTFILNSIFGRSTGGWDNNAEYLIYTHF